MAGKKGQQEVRRLAFLNKAVREAAVEPPSGVQGRGPCERPLPRLSSSKQETGICPPPRGAGGDHKNEWRSDAQDGAPGRLWGVCVCVEGGDVSPLRAQDPALSSPSAPDPEGGPH